MGWLVGFLFWILLAIHLPLSLLIGDACVLMDDRMSDLNS